MLQGYKPQTSSIYPYTSSMAFYPTLPIRAWFTRPNRIQQDPRPTPMNKWISAGQESFGTLQTVQRCDQWLTHAIISINKRNKRTRLKWTAEYRIEFYRYDNQPIDSSIILPTNELLSLQPYNYSDLVTKNTIRLIALLPGSGDEVIECELSVHFLESLPAYEALSYTWGKGRSHPIICNGRSIFIQENLRSALRRLRYSGSVRLLWIDALCINQGDTEERSSQVQHMRKIYHSATRVVVWLGESSKTSSIGFCLLTDIVLASRRETSSTMQKPMKVGELTLHGLPEQSSPRWHALGAIFWREWFTRIWIIQEVSVAQSVVVICGSDSCSWSEMAGTAQYISDHSLDAITDVDPKLVIKLSNFRMRDDPQRHLLRLLSEARNSYATDDRDKVYALLGLASDVGKLALLPDYSIGVSELYFNIVRTWIQKEQNLDILSAVEDHKYRARPDLPCWVPDWEVHDLSYPFSSHPDFTYMRAAGDSKAICTFGDDGKILNARGRIIDSLKYVGVAFDEYIPTSGTLPQGNLISDPLSRKRTRQWDRMAGDLKIYPSGESIERVFIQTLIGRAKLESQQSLDELQLSYGAWRRYWEVAQRERGKFIQFSHMELSTDDLARATYIMKAQQQTAYGRRFFTTKNGYMGLGSFSSRIDDQIVILLGGRTPFILRRTRENRYRFIGECYVHGMMNGEGLGQNSEMQDFHIW